MRGSTSQDSETSTAKPCTCTTRGVSSARRLRARRRRPCLVRRCTSARRGRRATLRVSTGGGCARACRPFPASARRTRRFRAARSRVAAAKVSCRHQHTVARRPELSATAVTAWRAHGDDYDRSVAGLPSLLSSHYRRMTIRANPAKAHAPRRPSGGPSPSSTTTPTTTTHGSNWAAHVDARVGLASASGRALARARPLPARRRRLVSGILRRSTWTTGDSRRGVRLPHRASSSPTSPARARARRRGARAGRKLAGSSRTLHQRGSRPSRSAVAAFARGASRPARLPSSRSMRTPASIIELDRSSSGRR